MAFSIDNQTGQITFGVVSDGTNDAIARDLASEFGVSEDFKDTFNADNWVDAGTAINVNTGSEEIDWNVNDTSINHATAFDLGIISNTTWVLRAKLTVNNVVAGASADTNRLYFGIFDSDQSVDSNTLQDGLFIGFLRGSTANQIGLFHRDGVILDGIADVAFTTPITATTFFIEIKRTSTMAVTMSLFSDAKYTTLIETQSAVIPTTIQSLRFIKAQNRSTLTGNSTLDGTIDNVQFWNTTSVPRITSLDWRIRFKLNITNLDDGGNTIDKRLWMSMSDSDETVGADSVQDSINLFIAFDTNTNRFLLRDTNGQAPNGVGNDALFTPNLVTVSTKFVEIKRTSSTAYSASLFSDSTFTTLIESQSGVVSAGTTNLRFIKFMNGGTLVNGAGAIDGTIDDFVYTDFEQLIVMPIKTFIVDAVLEGCTSDFCEDFNEYSRTKLPFPRDNFNYSTQALADASWVPNLPANQRVDPVNENVFWTMIRNGTDNRLTFDLGTGISETNWVLRCHLHVNAGGVLGSPQGNYSILLQDTDVAQLSINNSIGWGLLNSSSGRQYILTEIVGGVNGNQDLAPLGAYTSPDDLFLEMTRISTNEARMRIYSDANFSILQDEQTIAVGDVTNLRFLILSCSDDPAGFAGTETGTVDNIEFWNEGQQGDITFQDSFLQKPVTFSDNFVFANQTLADTAWVPQDVSLMRVIIANEDLQWNSTIDGTNNSIAHDLGVGGVNDEQWALRFKYTTASLDVGSNVGKYIWFGLFDSDGTVDSETTQDAIAFYIAVNSTINTINLAQRDGVILSNAGTDATLTTINTASDTFFVELKRTSATTAELTLYSDSTYTTVIESTTLTIPATLTGLRFIAIKNRNITATTGFMNGTIDDVQFYNGNSTLTDWSGATGNDVGLDIINKRINFDIPQGVLRDEFVAFDLQTILDGNNADDKHWTLRFKLDADSITQGTSEQSATLFIGIDNNLDPTTSATHDLIALRISIDQGGAGPQFGVVSGIRQVDGGQYLSGGSGVNFPFQLSTGTRFVELKRISSTLAECTLFTDATYRTPEKDPNGAPLTVQIATTALVNDLRYIRITTDSSAVANDTVWDGAIDDVEFYNGVSVPRTPISELPILFEDRVLTDKGWVTTDATAMAVNLTTQVLDINVLRDSTQDAIAFDLGAGVLSETRWGLRFKYDITAVNPVNTGTKRIAMGLFDTNQVASIASPQDYIGITFSLATDTTNVFANATNNSNPQSLSFGSVFTSVITQVQTYYIEIIRISADLYSVEIFSDPDYSISLEKVTNTITSLISGLRFIKFLGDETSGPVDGSFTGTIDDIQLWNGQAPLDHRNKWRVLDL